MPAILVNDMGTVLLEYSKTFTETAIPTALYGLAHQNDERLHRDVKRMQFLSPQTVHPLTFPSKAAFDFGYRTLVTGVAGQEFQWLWDGPATWSQTNGRKCQKVPKSTLQGPCRLE